MSVEKAHSREEVGKSKHGIAIQNESCGKYLKHERESSSDHIVDNPQEKMNDLSQKIETSLLATKLSNMSTKWIMILMVSVLLINFTTDWKSMINMIMEMAFVICLLTTMFLFGLVGKDKQSIAKLEKQIDKKQSKINIILNASKKREAQHAKEVEGLLDKLKKKEQEKMELMRRIEVLSDKLKVLRADGSTKSAAGSLTLEENSKETPKKSTITQTLAEMHVDPKIETQELRRSKILLAENASVLIEDLRKGLRELSSPKKVKPS